MKYSFIVLFFLCVLYSYAEQQTIIYGKISDQKTGLSIPGASVQVEGTSKGTYANAYGFFRLPLEGSSARLKISSIGYKAKTMEVKPGSDTLAIRLEVSPVMGKGAIVTGDMDADLIMKRAIEKKNENRAKLKTFSGELYSKLSLEFGGSVFSNAGTEASEGSISVTIGSSTTKVADKYKMFVLETFSRNYKDTEAGINKSYITGRRQTANIAADKNILALAEFFDFTDDRIRIINADMISPLGEDAFDVYEFELLEKYDMEGRYIYLIKVTPKTTTYPAFHGTLKIAEKTYDIAELDLKPSESTAFAFISDLKFTEKFKESPEGVWYPAFLDVSAKANVDVISGFIDVKADLSAVSIYNDVGVNKPLPDSVYKKEVAYISVSPLADSLGIEYWQKNSLRDISERELEMYTTIDSLVKADTSSQKQAERGFVSTSFFPYAGYNRVESYSLGATLGLGFGEAAGLKGTAYWTPSQKWMGEASLNLPVLRTTDVHIDLTGKVHSLTQVFGGELAEPWLVNSVTSLFGYDYYDYYRSDGWGAELDISITSLPRLKLEYTNDRQFCQCLYDEEAPLSGRDFRINPAIAEGEYGTFRAELSQNFAFPFLTDNNASLSLGLKGFSTEYGSETYNGYSGSMEISLPLFRTGYDPMELDIYAAAGKASENTPYQYLYRMSTARLVIGSYKDIISAPIGAFAGTEFFQLGVKYEFTDLLWRAIGLPLTDGRGVGLTVGGSMASFKSGGDPFFINTDDEPYMEAGFGFSRIPVPFSNVIFLETEMRWGMGKYGSKNFGLILGINFPF